MLPILDDLVDKFDDPAQADALTSVIHSNDFELTTEFKEKRVRAK